MDELLRDIAIVLEQQYKDKTVDYEFMNYIFEELKRMNGLDEYLSNGFTWGGESPFILGIGGYSFAEKMIQFFDLTEGWIRSGLYDLLKKVSPDNKKFVINLFLIGTMFHEIEHAKQDKICDTEESFEAYLFGLTKDKTETTESYGCSPNERFAEVKSLDALSKIYSMTSIIEPELEKEIICRKYSVMTDGYYYYKMPDDNMYPLKKYCTIHNIPHSEISLDESIHTMESTDNRLLYGYPVSEEELSLAKIKAGKNDSSINYSI